MNLNELPQCRELIPVLTDDGPGYDRIRCQLPHEHLYDHVAYREGFGTVIGVTSDSVVVTAKFGCCEPTCIDYGREVPDGAHEHRR